MAGIREVISQEEGDGLRDAVLLSTKPASDLLGQLYSKAVFAGRHVQVHEPAPEGDLDELFKTFAKVSPTLKRTDTTRKALEADAAYQKFVKGHVKFGLYKTTIMKCNDPDCPYHKPVRMPKAVWDTLTWFPDATLDANSKTSGWRSFANSWGKPTTEKDYPSKKQAVKVKDDRMNTRVLHGKYAVGWVRCSLPSCGKPRVLFKAKPLTAEEKTAVQLLEENTDYTCGAPVTMAGHALHGQLFARASLRCSDPVEYDYYLKSKKFPPCCSLCGETGVELSKRSDQTALYRDVLPLCAPCVDDDKYAPVRYNKKFAEAKAAKQAAAAKADAQQKVATARDPKSVWDGAMHGGFTKEQVEEFPKTCCRQQCLVSGKIAFQPNDPSADGSPKYDSSGKAAGVVQGRKCAKCKGLWHDLCCSSEVSDGTAKMPFDADGIEGVCFDCKTAGASVDDAVGGFSEAEVKAAFEAGGFLEDITEASEDEEVSAMQEAIIGLCEGNELLKLRWTPRAHFVAAGFEFVWRALRTMPGADGGGSSGVARSDATADDGTLISGSEDADQDESEVAPDELSDDEYEIEEIIELRENSKPMQWLVKWKGWPLDRDKAWSYVKRDAFVTDGSHKMLLEFERARKAKEKGTQQQAKTTGGKKRARQGAAGSSQGGSSSDDEGTAAGGRGRGRGRGRKGGRGRPISPLVPPAQQQQQQRRRRARTLESDYEGESDEGEDYDDGLFGGGDGYDED